jgi:hypothetical protein
VGWFGRCHASRLHADDPGALAIDSRLVLCIHQGHRLPAADCRWREQGCAGSAGTMRLASSEAVRQRSPAQPRFRWRRRPQRKSSENAEAKSQAAIRPAVEPLPTEHQPPSPEVEVSVPVRVLVAVDVGSAVPVLVWVLVAVSGAHLRHA